MVSRPSRRGRGSNQYADRAPSLAEAGSLGDSTSRLSGAAPAPVGTAVAGDHITARSTASLVMDLRGSFSRLVSGQVENTPQAVINAVTEFGAAEDGIMTKHPDAYGLAVTDGVAWGAKAEARGTRENKAVSAGDELASSLDRDYRAVLGDAAGDPEQALDVDQLTSTLERIVRDEAKWSGTPGEGPASGESQPSSLACRHAALSAVCSRSSQASVDLREELASVGEELNRRMLARTGL